LRFRIALPSTAFTQRLSGRTGATTASQGFGPTIRRPDAVAGLIAGLGLPTRPHDVARSP
jgi:hypothetical protein